MFNDTIDRPLGAGMGEKVLGTNAKTKYQILEQPIGSTRHLRIITIGAGASGLNVIRTLRKHLTDFEHVVYEKNPDVGGTWFENRYPGCKCDIPSHNYQFSWKPNPEWREFFSDASEIHSYFRRLCEDEGMLDCIKLSHQVTDARWNEREGMWYLKIENIETREILEDKCHFLLDGSGILNNWKWPAIKGLDKFQGELVHSANWPESFYYRGKRVAVIGNGSSGVQIVPAVQPDVAKLVHFIRSPTWIAPPGMDKMAASSAASIISAIEMDGVKFTERQIKAFKEDPALYRRFVKATEEVVNSKFNILVNDSDAAAQAKQGLSNYMTYALENDKRLTDILIPQFPVGCRRITPGVGYLPALHKENVEVVTDPIEEVLPNGLKTKSGNIFEVDAIVCATGFDVGFVPRFPLTGRNGNLQDEWKKNTPAAYMSCAVSKLPNYFMFLGPSAPIGHGSVLTITEHVAKYIVKIIKKCQMENIKAVVPKESAIKEFSEHIEKFMPRTAWSGTCRSWFKNGLENGPVTALHPGSRIHWFQMMENPRGEDYDYTYFSSNRFAYLGNGYGTKELGVGDPTWYLDRPDELF